MCMGMTMEIESGHEPGGLGIGEELDMLPGPRRRRSVIIRSDIPTGYERVKHIPMLHCGSQHEYTNSKCRMTCLKG